MRQLCDTQATKPGELHMAERMDLEADLLAFEHLLEEDERAARDSVRNWVQARYLPRLTEAHRTGYFPTELIPRSPKWAFWAPIFTATAAPGMNNVSYGLVLQELERGDSGLRSFCSVQGSLVMYPILSFGNEAQRKKWLPELASGRMIGCFGLTEPNAGSDPAAMKTTARKEGDTYILDGIKAWITNSPLAHLAVIWAKVVDEGNKIRGFVVERGTPGISTPDIAGKFSLRASATGEIHLTECRVPAANLLPESGGLKKPPELPDAGA